MFNILRQNRTISPSQEFLNFAGEYSNKYLVKDIVKEKIPDIKVAKVLQKCDRFEDFNIELLPDTFVIKVSHWCGDSKVVTKEEFRRNYEQYKTYYNSLLTKKYNPGREPHYTYIKPILFIEEYLGDNLLDIKFHCIHGAPVIIKIVKNDQVSMFNLQWEQMNFTRTGKQVRKLNIQKPKNLNMILKHVHTLTENIDYVRLDMYLNKDEDLIFGEYTFTPIGCQSPHFTNSNIDKIFNDIYNKKHTDLTVFEQFKLI